MRISAFYKVRHAFNNRQVSTAGAKDNRKSERLSVNEQQQMEADK